MTLDKIYRLDFGDNFVLGFLKSYLYYAILSVIKGILSTSAAN